LPKAKNDVFNIFDEMKNMRKESKKEEMEAAQSNSVISLGVITEQYPIISDIPYFLNIQQQ